MPIQLIGFWTPIETLPSAICEHMQRFLLLQFSALFLVFNCIISNGHLNPVGQIMNSLPSHILMPYAQYFLRTPISQTTSDLFEILVNQYFSIRQTVSDEFEGIIDKVAEIISD